MNQVLKSAMYCFVCAATVCASIPGAHAFDLDLMFVDEMENPLAGVVVEMLSGGADTDSIDSSTAVSVIDQIERRFVPMVLLIATGQYVDFPNSDNVRHHVYSFSDIKQFSTPLYADENIEPVLFDKPGIAVLGCNIHDSMVAYVYVSDSPHRAVSDDTGNLVIAGLPVNPGKISVWHPWLQTPDNRFDIDVSAIAEGAQLRVRLPARSPDTRFGFRALVPQT